MDSEIIKSLDEAKQKLFKPYKECKNRHASDLILLARDALQRAINALQEADKEQK